MGNFSTVRVCFKNFSTKKKIEHVHWHASWPKCISISSFVIVFRAFMDRITLYVYNNKSSVQNNLPVMLWLDDDWMKFDPKSNVMRNRQHKIVWKYIIWIYSGTEEADLWQSERKCVHTFGNEGSSEMWNVQSRQKGTAEAELPIFGNEDRVLVEKPIFRSLAVKIKRNCKYLEVQAEMKWEIDWL